jgi:hypothetical protein
MKIDPEGPGLRVASKLLAENFPEVEKPKEQLPKIGM